MVNKIAILIVPLIIGIIFVSGCTDINLFKNEDRWANYTPQEDNRFNYNEEVSETYCSWETEYMLEKYGSPAALRKYRETCN